jgi:hypothetical protein
MAMDLGINDFVSFANRGRVGENVPAITIPAAPTGTPAWTEARAIDLSGRLNAANTGLRATANNQRDATRDFLSLYWATKGDLKERDAAGAQTGQWVIRNGTTDAEKTTIQNLLFRGADSSGLTSATTSLISRVHIGADTRTVNGASAPANRFPQINAVLTALGIDSTPVVPHEHHFHVYLRPPAAKVLNSNGGTNLLADSIAHSSAHATEGAVLHQEMETMLVAAKFPKVDRAIKRCQTWGSAAEVEPDTDAKYLYVKGRGTSPAEHALWVKEWNALTATRIQLVEPPLYGTYTIRGGNTNGVNGYTYIPPSKDYKGEDRWSFLVELSNGKRVLVRYQMSPGQDDLDDCKLNLLSQLDGLSADEQVASNTSDLLAWIEQALRARFLSEASGVSYSFYHLAGRKRSPSWLTSA